MRTLTNARVVGGYTLTIQSRRFWAVSESLCLCIVWPVISFQDSQWLCDNMDFPEDIRAMFAVMGTSLFLLKCKIHVFPQTPPISSDSVSKMCTRCIGHQMFPNGQPSMYAEPKLTWFDSILRMLILSFPSRGSAFKGDQMWVRGDLPRRRNL